MMVWKNPFLSKNSEHKMQENEFLSLFDCTVLQMIEERNLSMVSFVSSTPGAGKTSLFRAFSSEVLGIVAASENHDEYDKIYKQMERLGAIQDGKVSLATTMLSCARNYSILDEMFQNGRRKQIFFALINYRIAITLLRNIGRLLDMRVDSYDRISFRNIPVEMMSEAEKFENGYTVYEWACEGERTLCEYLDSERDEKLSVSFVHTTLLVIKLFEPDNMIIDGRQYFSNTLIIFDDFHKLSENQRNYIVEAAYTLKSSVGIWLGQRLEGLKNVQLISMDGSLSREYNPNIVIDNYWPDRKDTFYGMLENIADRRVKEAAIGNYKKFSECMEETLEKKYGKVVEKDVNQMRHRLQSREESHCRYGDVIAYVESKGMEPFEKAIWYECMIIHFNRKHSGQLSFYMGEKERPEEFQDFVKENKKAAWYYICCRCKIPYYIGLNNLCMLSSYNVQQFLVFAGDIFDCCRIKLLDPNSRARGFRLTAEEQETIIQNVAKRRWEDMDYRYTDIGVIKAFLDNIADWGKKSRDAERNSYSGGAYTGIGINNDELKRCVNDSRFELLFKVLGACMASRYLERREIKGGTTIFYLNRWLCVYYQLPLAYGGWKKCRMEEALDMCRSNYDADIEGQFILDF